MPRSIFTISLPERLREYIEERVRESGYASTSEYFRELVRDDIRRSESEFDGYGRQPDRNRDRPTVRTADLSRFK